MMWRLAFWWRGWRYRRQARHLAGEVETPGWGSHAFGTCLPGCPWCELERERDFYGLMDREAERGWLPAPEVARSGWWGQTVADLAPEALALEVMPSEPGDWPGLGHMSSGPGDLTSLAPGPDTARLAWLDRQLAAHADWARRMRGQVTGWGLEAAA